MISRHWRITPDVLAERDRCTQLDLWYGRRGRYTAYVYVLGQTMTLCIAEIGVPGPIIWSRLHAEDGVNVLDEVKDAIDLLYWDGVVTQPLGATGATS